MRCELPKMPIIGQAGVVHAQDHTGFFLVVDTLSESCRSGNAFVRAIGRYVLPVFTLLAVVIIPTISSAVQPRTVLQETRQQACENDLNVWPVPSELKYCCPHFLGAICCR
ncbi:MAG: hypothetical protein JWO19_3380 [Bryobacterales bacterium]|nr:hypothetical protein [Bryobacterales bacterium]